MGLDKILGFTIIVDMESGECDIHYPMDVEFSELEMLKTLREIVTSCYYDLRDDYRMMEGED